MCTVVCDELVITTLTGSPSTVMRVGANTLTRLDKLILFLVWNSPTLQKTQSKYYTSDNWESILFQVSSESSEGFLVDRRQLLYELLQLVHLSFMVRLYRTQAHQWEMIIMDSRILLTKDW